MKKFLLTKIVFCLVSVESIAQTQLTINSAPIIGATQPVIFNNNSNPRVIAEFSWQRNIYNNDFLRISNARGTNGLPQGFTPMIHGNSGTGAGLALLANIPTGSDNGSVPIMTFTSRVGFIQEGYQGATIGAGSANRPTFQWVNGVSPQMTMLPGGRLGVGTTTPGARFHIWTNKVTLANQRISTEDMTLELGVTANNGEYSVQKGDAMIWVNQTSNVPNLRGNLYINTGSSSNVNTPNSRNIILGPLNRNTLVISDAGRVGIGLDNYGTITNVTRPERLLHVNSRNVADIRFQNLPQRNCGFLLMVDENGDVFRTRVQGDPCIEVCATTTTRPALGERYEELVKQIEILKKEVDNLKSKVK